MQQTLANTSQLVTTVEAESRELMRDHRVTRLYPLRPHRINDTCYSDTFFSSLSSIRGFTMFQLFALKHSKVDYIYLMRKKSQAAEKFSDFVRNVGAPNYVINDSAMELTGDAWLTVARKAIIDTYCSEPFHQNQNLAERRGGALKESLQILYNHTPTALLKYW